MSEKNELSVSMPRVLDSLVPIEVRDAFSGLEAAIIERYELSELTPEWDTTSGVFILLSPIDTGNHWHAYVSRTSGSFRGNIRALEEEVSEMWALAVLFKREAGNDFTDLETRYLEDILTQVVGASQNVDVLNFIDEDDDTDFSSVDAEQMRMALQSAIRVLFLRGYRNSAIGAISKSLSELYEDASGTTSRPALRKLQDWRKNKARVNSKPEYLFGTNKELESITLAMPKTVEELQSIPKLQVVLKSFYADEIVELLNS